MKKIRPIIRNWFDQLIKQNLIGKKAKMIRKKLKNKIINDIWTHFKTEGEKKKIEKKKKNEKKLTKDKIKRDIRTLFRQEEEEDYYEPKRVNDFWNNNYTEYETNSDKKRDLLLDEYLNNIKPYSRNIIINLQNCDTLKILLTTATNFIFSKDGGRERVMHSSSNNIKFTS